MATKTNKFGTFGGVFVPSILTILGVIMYLRLPRVIGQGGLFQVLGIILAAHVISVTTGLSISSIATDKKVGAGGPYYIVSRSLGLPIGGTLGLALFVGLSFSVSLYVIGFCESFLPEVGLSSSLNSIRLWGSIVLAVVTLVTLASTALALKMQYVILALIALSIFSILMGSPDLVPASPQLEPTEGAPSFAVLFGIFFPAVTGFTAGVNMSGDLKDPKKSLPLGTMAAIGAGLFVYVGLAIFLAYRIPAELLLGNTSVLVQVAWVPVLVVAGIWGATISSAMGSILGAPRILQALSEDRVTPRFFAKGAGKANEPRRALLLACLIAESGILIGQLDVIARIVSMFFIATYGFLNLSCAIESWAGTSFRPTFKIPRMVSVIGAATCVLVMIQLDMLAMFGAVFVFAGLFFYLKRRELSLEKGDAWGGVWFSMVRSNLTRLEQQPLAASDFRPNILAFSRKDSPVRPPLVELGTNLVHRVGVLTDIELCRKAEKKPKQGEVTKKPKGNEESAVPAGIFHRSMASAEPYDLMHSMVQHYGFAGLEPNSLLLAWAEHREQTTKLASLLGDAAEQDLNVLLWAPSDYIPRPPGARRIDVWWAPDRGNFTFCLDLVGFLIDNESWQLSEVRFLLVNDQASRTDALLRTARRHCHEARVEASVKVLNNTLGDRSYEEWVRRESTEADLVVLTMPGEKGIPDEPYLENLDELLSPLGQVLLVRPATTFPKLLGFVSEPSVEIRASLATSGEPFLEQLAELELPEVPELANETLRLSTSLGQMADELSQRGLRPVFQSHLQLIARVKTMVTARFDNFEKALQSPISRRHKASARIQTSFFQQMTKLLEDFEREELGGLQEGIEEQLGGLPGVLEVLRDGAPGPVLMIEHSGEKTEAQDGEGASVPSKSKSKGAGAPLKTVVPLEWILDYYLDYRIPHDVDGVIAKAGSHAVGTAFGLLRSLNTVRLSLALLASRMRRDELTPEQIAKEREDALSGLQNLESELEQSWVETRSTCKMALSEIVSNYAADLQRREGRSWVRRERRIPKKARQAIPRLLELPQLWFDNESLLWRRAMLDLRLGSFHGRLVMIGEKTKEVIQIEIGGGVVSELALLRSSLEKSQTEIEKGDRLDFDLPSTLGTGFDEKRLLDETVRRTSSATSALPESVETATEEGIARLEADPFIELESVSVTVRRLAEFTLQSELLGRLQLGLSEAVTAEAQALGVARDVLRLISFNINDLEEDDDETFRARMEPIITEGTSRLDKELEGVRVFVPRLAELIDKQIEMVAERTGSHVITSTAVGARTPRATEGAGRKVLASVGERMSEARSGVREAFTGLLYRRSAGVVLARNKRAGLSHEEMLVEQVIQLTESCMPRPEALKTLPFYYQHPFLGKSRTSADFWVGRDSEMEEAKRAFARARQGARGAVIVAGERNSGKTALSQTIAAAACPRDRVHHIFPPPGGSVDPRVFKRALEDGLGAQGDYPALFAALPERSAIVLHDVELWWQRSEHGLNVLETIQRLVDEQSGSCLFVLNLNIHALRFINRLVPLTDQALALVECGPLDARALKEIVLLRHRTTGFSFQLGNHSEESLGEFRLARLFTRHFDFSGGTVGVALQSWIAHIREIQDKSLVIVPPERPDLEVLHELPMETITMLLELILHQQVTFSRLARITELHPPDLRHQLNTLSRMRLVVEDKQGSIEINRYMAHLVRAHLLERGLVV